MSIDPRHHVKLWPTRRRIRPIRGENIHVIFFHLYHRLWCVRSVHSGSQNAWFYFIRPLGTGVQVILYCNCASRFWKQRNCQWKYTFFRLAYITVLLILATLNMATAIWVLVDMYIENRNYPGGPMAYFLATHQPLGSAVFGSLFASNFMGDLLVVSTTHAPFSHPYS